MPPLLPIVAEGRDCNPAVTEIADLDRWVNWKAEKRGDKITKVPYTPGGTKAKSTDPATWSDFDSCWIAAFMDGRFDGIGFVFADTDDLFGVDLDACIRDGKLDQAAAGIVASFQSYAEISPSGTGIKILVHGHLPASETKYGRKNGWIEAYAAKRFFTITGNRLESAPEAINVNQAAIDRLWAHYFAGSGKAGSRKSNSALPPYPDQRALEELLRDPYIATLWGQRFMATPAIDQSPSGWDLAFAGLLARKGLERDRIAAFLRAYRKHHAPQKGKHDRADYIWATVDEALGDQVTFAQIDGQTKQPDGIKGASVTPRPTSWLWYPYFPAGELSLIGARGGVGKGQACASIVARCTAGILWPDGQEKAATGTVLWAEAEDSIDKTVVPRLIANCADLRKTVFYTEDEFAALDLAKAVKTHDARIIILSPIISFLPRLKSHINELLVRAALKGLRGAIDGTMCALIGIAHLNKKADLDAIERLLGAVAFANFVRSVVLLATDKERPDMRRFVHAKFNLSPRGPDLLFRTVHCGPDLRDQFVGTEWEVPSGQQVDIDTFFTRKTGYGDADPTARSWLVEYLKAYGETPASGVIKAAEASGFTADAIQKARKREPRCKTRKENFGQGWLWCID